MAEEKKVILTREGYEKLEKELDYYISVRRNEISEQIAIARGFGDLSENAEYDEAKNEQSRIEAKIVEMETPCATASWWKTMRLTPMWWALATP